MSSIEKNLIDPYINKFGGQSTMVEDGVLGLGTIVLHSAPGKRDIVIKEFFINPWKSGHSVRQYNNLPKKYQTIINSL